MIVTKKIIDREVLVVNKDNTINENCLLSKLMDKNGMVLFFYPKDFTFVCPTEIIAFQKELENFHKLGYQVVGCSTDSEFSHIAWKNTLIENGGIGQVQYPLIADIKKELARDLDILFDDAVALRATFIIDENMVVRHATINDLPLGRNISETLRTAEALNFVKVHGEVCPANWNRDKKAMKPTTEGVAEFLKKNLNEI